MIAYVFVYGSLVDKKSRESTINTEMIYKCVLEGKYSRFWTYHPRDHSRLVLGMSPHISKGKINGLLLIVDDYMLSKLDEREHKYTRVEIDKKDLVINKILDSDIPLYTYLLHRDRELDIENNLENSRYMYICFRGFLAYGNTYVKQFMETTDGWKYPWMNYYVDSYKKIC